METLEASIKPSQIIADPECPYVSARAICPDAQIQIGYRRDLCLASMPV